MKKFTTAVLIMLLALAFEGFYISLEISEQLKVLQKIDAANSGCDTANIHGYDISDCDVDPN